LRKPGKNVWIPKRDFPLKDHAFPKDHVGDYVEKIVTEEKRLLTKVNVKKKDAVYEKQKKNWVKFSRYCEVSYH